MLQDLENSTKLASLLAIVSIATFFILVHVLTWTRFYLQTWNFDTKEKGDLHPPKLPYNIPWLGSARIFLNKTPHKFWTDIFTWYPMSRGTFSILLGGKRQIVIFNKTAVNYILKERKLDRNESNEMVVINAFGLSSEQCDKIYEYYSKPHDDYIPGHVFADKLNNDYLLKSDAVTEMTNEFVKCFRRQLSEHSSDQETGVYTWLRKHMFVASTTSLMGSRLLDVAPSLEEDFFSFDQNMLSLFFGLPNFMVRPALNARDKLIGHFKRWHEMLDAELQGSIIGPDAPEAWEPNYGSRINRARQLYYRRQGINVASKAGLDAGELFGISSNSIMAAGWMLFHVLASKADPSPNLYDYLVKEVKESQKADGSIDVPHLMTRPVLLSTLHETLRVYVDVLVSRTIRSPTILPLSHKDSKTTSGNTGLKLEAGSFLLAPSWPSHNNPDVWEMKGFPSAKTFYAYRFLKSHPDAKQDKPVFSTEPFAGSFLPFGGGKTMCPGRTFAKQEILASVAVIMLGYDIEVLSYLDGNGRETTSFPGLRDTYPGSAVMVAKGDIKVELKKRNSS